ncbi:MAG: hypothetical protein ABI418_06015 [Jatrophihabitantaceae bacterium]
MSAAERAVLRVESAELGQAGTDFDERVAALAGVSAKSAALLCLVERDLGAEPAELGVIGSARRGWMRRRRIGRGLIVGGAVVELQAG